MAQDLRDLIQNSSSEAVEMNTGHEARFLEKLEETLPEQQQKRPIVWWQIAASIAVLICISIWYFKSQTTTDTIVPAQVVENSTSDTPKVHQISLGDLSPGLKKIEDYYSNSIQLELMSLEETKENKELVQSTMSKLGALNTEYEQLNKELNKYGPNEKIVTALIKNLQFKLQLFHQLNDKLNELKKSKNETIESKTI